MFLQDVIKEFIFEIKLRNYSERTIKGYKNNILKFARYMKNEFEIVEIEEISHVHIKSYLNFLKGNGLTEVYINTILKNLRSFYKYCFTEGYCLNVALKVGCLRERKTIIKTFSDDEIRKMMDVYNYSSYIHARNKCIMAILIDTGIRNFELCQLKITDIRETVIYIMGKGKKERVVPISPYLKKIMIKYERIREGYLKNNILHYDNYFLSYRNKPLTIEAVERIVRLCGEKANVNKNIRCSPHTLRHYFAQSQLKNGLDVYSLSRLLGHENVTITKRYLQGLKDKEVLELGVKSSPLMNLKK